MHLTHSLVSQLNNIIELSSNLFWMSGHVASTHFSHTLLAGLKDRVNHYKCIMNNHCMMKFLTNTCHLPCAVYARHHPDWFVLTLECTPDHQ